MLNDKTARTIATTLVNPRTTALNQFVQDGLIFHIAELIKEIEQAYDEAKSTRVLAHGFKSKQQMVIQKLIDYAKSGTRLRWRLDKKLNVYHTSWSPKFDTLPYIK